MIKGNNHYNGKEFRKIMKDYSLNTNKHIGKTRGKKNKQ